MPIANQKPAVSVCPGLDKDNRVIYCIPGKVLLKRRISLTFRDLVECSRGDTPGMLNLSGQTH